jgi:outer membrane lipoprotein-sorting protein
MGADHKFIGIRFSLWYHCPHNTYIGVCFCHKGEPVMRREKIIIFSMVFLMVLPPAIALSENTGLSSESILNHVDDLFRGDSSYAIMAMNVVTKHYTREMTMEGWTRGKDYSLIRVLSPLKEKDTSTLKAGNNIWNYLPKVNRVIKIPSSMMGGSWMGSHFTNDDLIKESRMADDYEHSIAFDGLREGVAMIDLELIPKPEAAVVWGKVIVSVRKKDLMPLKIDYYGERLDLERTMVFTDIREMGGRLLPAVVRINPTDKPQEYTQIIYKEIAFDLELKDSFFSLRTLQSGSAP